MVSRVYVEKKAGFDVEAKALERELREILGVTPNRLHSLLRDVAPVLGREMESRPKLRSCQSLKRCTVVLHVTS